MAKYAFVLLSFYIFLQAPRDKIDLDRVHSMTWAMSMVVAVDVKVCFLMQKKIKILFIF